MSTYNRIIYLSKYYKIICLTAVIWCWVQNPFLYPIYEREIEFQILLYKSEFRIKDYKILYLLVRIEIGLVFSNVHQEVPDFERSTSLDHFIYGGINPQESCTNKDYIIYDPN